MKKRHNQEEWENLRSKIIGLGENSTKRSYHPELQAKLAQLEKFKILLNDFVDGLIVVNLNNGLVEEANKSALHLLKELKIGGEIAPVLSVLEIENDKYSFGTAEGFIKAELKNYYFNASINTGGENRIFLFRIDVQEFSNIPYAVIPISDITEKERTIKAVKTSEANIHALIENTKDQIWSIDTEFRLLSMNSSFREHYRMYFNCDINIGDDIVSLIPEYKREHWAGYYRRALSGENITVEESSENIGVPIFVIISFSPIISEERITGVTVFLRDITERKKYELAIKENEEQLRKIIEGSPIGIVVSKKKQIDYANSAALSIFGYKDLSDVKNRYVADFLAPNESLNINEMFALGIRGVFLTERLEVTGLNANGECVPLFVSMTCIELYDGIAFVIFFDDVTKQKEIEQALIFAKTKAEESEKLKSEFLAQMSHEIRTPINTILSFSNLVGDELHNIVSDELKSSFEIIQKAGKRIIRTIDLILNMSEIQAGTYEVIFTRFKLFSAILYPLAKEYKPVASARGIDLIIENGHDDIPVFGDEYTITQIFANLIDNAVKYTEKGFVKVYVESADKHGNYSVAVEDSGIGISKEYLPDLFNPFSQEERGYTRRFEGNGLGLALVKKYCELNNADISVASEKNKGTKFIITFLKS